jgi:hypothetical protein
MTNDSAINYAIALLSHYGFELRGYTAQELVNLWLEHYQANWLRLGVIEALYQGRYKAISVEQILAVWARRGKPTYRFTHEFERLISRKFPKSWTTPQESNSTELNQELSLSSLTTSVQEISTGEKLPDLTSQEEAPPVKLETLPQAGNISSNLTGSPIQSTDQIPEVATEEDAKVRFQSQKSGVWEKHLGDNSSVKPKVYNPNADFPYVPTTKLTSSDGLKTDSDLTHNADWSCCEFSKLPIEQFTPSPDYSGFCLKLKAVVEQEDSTPVNSK